MITNCSIVRENIRLIYSIDVNLYTKDDVYARIIVVDKRLCRHGPITTTEYLTNGDPTRRSDAAVNGTT